MLLKISLNILSVVTIASLMISMSSCGSNKDLMEKNTYDTRVETTPLTQSTPLSTLAFEYKINKTGLNSYFNGYLDSMFLSSWDYPEEHVEAYITRMRSGTLECQDKRILITLPLQIDLDKKTLIGKWSAYGEILLTIVTDLDVNSNWNIDTKTEIINYEWIQTPKMKFGFIDIPIKSIANNISNRIKPFIEESIDAAVRENFDLREQASALLNPILQPYTLNQSVGGWITMNADSIHFSPWVNEEDYISGKIYAPFNTVVTTAQPEDQKVELPPFTWNTSIGSISTFKVQADLGYQYLTDLAKSNFVNKAFKNGKRVVKVEDLTIYGGPNRIGVEIQTSGSFKGLIKIEGEPYYNEGVLRARNLSWSVDTKNILHKAAAWIKKGFIHDQLEETLVFDLNSYINTAQSELYDVLADIKSERAIEFNLRWGKYDLLNLDCQESGLSFLMVLNVQIETVIDELPSEF